MILSDLGLHRSSGLYEGKTGGRETDMEANTLSTILEV